MRMLRAKLAAPFLRWRTGAARGAARTIDPQDRGRLLRRTLAMAVNAWRTLLFEAARDRRLMRRVLLRSTKAHLYAPFREFVKRCGRAADAEKAAARRERVVARVLGRVVARDQAAAFRAWTANAASLKLFDAEAAAAAAKTLGLLRVFARACGDRGRALTLEAWHAWNAAVTLEKRALKRRVDACAAARHVLVALHAKTTHRSLSRGFVAFQRGAWRDATGRRARSFAAAHRVVARLLRGVGAHALRRGFATWEGFGDRKKPRSDDGLAASVGDGGAFGSTPRSAASSSNVPVRVMRFGDASVSSSTIWLNWSPTDFLSAIAPPSRSRLLERGGGAFGRLNDARGEFGVSGCEFAELYSLDDGELARHAPVFGLIFLFKWTGEKDDRATLSFDEAPPGLFYAKQMVNNACATQAILSVLLNCEHVSRGATLDELKAFGAELPFDMRGLAIENSEAIRAAHNAFARPEPFVSDEKRATADDDVFHFVAYVPSGGKVYELDGLKAGPIDLGSFEDSWLPSAVRHRGAHQKYAASEIKFNLMAIVRDKRAALEDAKAAADAATAAELDAELAREHAKRADWAAENVRRHHNYVPFVVDLQVLAGSASSAP
ncbi:hypothetical protein JL722_10025 [Aureococcus anophagefferens]|nr:hypothetical protein JL722_10025 [Aureococcus anophagefferens]